MWIPALFVALVAGSSSAGAAGVERERTHTVVTAPDGAVQTKKLETPHLCAEARSMVLYGKTLEEKAAADEAAKVAAARADQEYKDREKVWLAAHPSRPATQDEMTKAYGKHPLLGNDVQGQCVSEGPCYFDNTPDHMGYSTINNNEVVFKYSPSYRFSSGSVILGGAIPLSRTTYAECFGSAPEDK